VTLHGSFRLFAATVNSLYSFWWDLSNDWGLELLKPRSPESRSSPTRAAVYSKLTGSPDTPVVAESHPSSSQQVLGGAIYRQHSYPFGLRPVLLYPLAVYPLVIFFNLILRMTWSIKLSSHLYSHSEGSALIFWLEIAEVLRRWMWVFIRVEWEVVKSAQQKSRNMIIGEEVELMPSVRPDPMDD
jgi:hypothetical protein